MGSRLIRVVVRICANSFGMIAILAMTAQSFDATELTAFFAFCVWLLLVEASVALAKVEPVDHRRGYAHVGLLSAVAALALTVAPPSQPKSFDFSTSYYASLSSIR